MEIGPFQYGTIVQGPTFTDRHRETKKLIENFRNGTNTILISPRRWGKSSLVNHAAKKIQKKTLRFCFIDLFNIRTEEDFYRVLSTEVIKSGIGKWQQWLKNIQNFFKQLTPKFSVGPHTSSQLNISLNWEEIKKHPSEILDLAEAICKSLNLKMVICIDEFQNISFYQDPVSFQKRLRAHWQHHRNVTYCLYGSKRHMLLEFFSNSSMPFYNFGDIITLDKIPESHWIEFIQDRFKDTLKIISADLASQIATITKNHPYFVQQLAQQTWTLTDKECNVKIFEAATEELLRQSSFLFQREVDLLTLPQLNFLRAIIEGVQKFTSVSSLKEYKLGTAGNVKRIKESLEKFELIDTVSDRPEILDPFFELWLEREYFKTEAFKIRSDSRDEITSILARAIEEKRLIRFYYESASSNKKEWRIVEPYIIGIKDNGKGNYFLAALPISELAKDSNDRIMRHYLLNKIDITKLEVLEETYDKPHVEKKMITDTPSIKVIVRHKYPNESDNMMKKKLIKFPTMVHLRPYRGKISDHGVSAYEIGDDFIIVKFKKMSSDDKQTYLYTYDRPGELYVEEMKKRANDNNGLTTYKNKFVKNNYAAYWDESLKKFIPNKK